MDRPNPGRYSARERLLRILRHQPVDRLPIVPTAVAPCSWHADFADYQPVIDVAARHCEFLPSFGLNTGLCLCDPAALDMHVEKTTQGTRKINTTTLHTPKGDLTEIRVHDPAVGGWATSKFFINSDADLEAWLSLPYRMIRPDLSGVAAFSDRIGQAGLPYVNGVQNALHLATHAMGEEYRIMFCFGEPDRLQEIVELNQRRLSEFVDYVLDGTAAVPDVVFRWYACEPYVEPIQPPRFIDRFVVPFDRELVRRIHDRGRYVITHCHGRLRAQISRFVQIGFDGVDCVESPPQNDATLAEMMAAAAGKLFLWGYIQFEDLAHKTPEEVEAMVRDAVAVGGTDGRYVLGQAASPWMANLPGRTAENMIRMIQIGVECGGH